MTPEVEPQYEDLENQDHAGRLGMWVFIASEVLFFGALFALYAGYRATWPQEFAEASHHAKLVIGTINTYVLVTSSLCVAVAVSAIRANRRGLVKAMLAATIVLAFTFLVLKFTEYKEHFDEGIKPGAAFHYPVAPGRGVQAYFTLYYAMTGLHSLHVMIGIGLLSWLFLRVHRGHYSAEGHLGVEVVGIYWHFVDAVWLFLWPTFYLIH